MDTSKIHVYENDINIEDSYAVSKKEFGEYLDYVGEHHPENAVIMNRSRFSLKMEWATHNMCYNIGIRRDETKDVDLNYPQKWYMTAAYAVCGVISWVFIR